MRFDVLLLAALPSVMAAKLAYSPPASLLSMASAEDSDCTLPAEYKIQNFHAQSNNTGSTLDAFDFKYIDAETQVTTLCHFNETSKSTTPDTLTPRYACEDGEVKFIWEDSEGQLTLIERICPSDGKAQYEVSGGLQIELVCGRGGSCATNSTSQVAKFSSLQPVRDPTLRV
ncbi:hypothetical protein GMORB2_6887 [Geosmithia morbida]|uniref:AA1-like domain-containing protein n=1 Tax=Geosmithia morbida TaxID=1094350 RepID=A0A9P5D3I8_9HYPO|nr:uncharacterized protein GMORB2_6887 [Geosmithia morbida]KAF4122581.1 hypothetical protein GMORB2_6887 [Geosmithia morbida]